MIIKEETNLAIIADIRANVIYTEIARAHGVGDSYVLKLAKSIGVKRQQGRRRRKPLVPPVETIIRKGFTYKLVGPVEEKVI